MIRNKLTYLIGGKIGIAIRVNKMYDNSSNHKLPI